MQPKKASKETEKFYSMPKLLTSFAVLLIALASSFSSFGQSVGGVTSGGATYCGGNNSGFISLTGHVGNVLHWESSTDLVIWTNIGNPTVTQSYLNLTQTTHYRAIVQDGIFPPDTSTVSTVFIIVPAEGGTINGGGTFCDQTGTGTLTLTGNVGLPLYWQFSIDGGNTWTQVANTTTSLNYPNITVNTIYEAVVENDPTCPVDTSSQVSFVIDPLSVAGTVSSSDTVCENINSGTLTHSGATGAVLDWIISTDNGVTWTSLSSTGSSYSYSGLTQDSWYAVVVQSGVCAPDTTSPAQITVVQAPAVDAGPDAEIVNHQSIVLEGSGSGTPSWIPSETLDDPNILDPNATPQGTITYFLTITNATGCSATDSVTITVDFPLPSAITPNGDGVNDFFFVDKLEEIPDNSFTVWNRQGNVVYQAAPYANEWQGFNQDGVDLPDGIYYYVFDLGNGADPFTGYVLIKR